MAVAVVVLSVAWVPVAKLGPWPPEAAGALVVGLPGLPLLVARARGRTAGRPAGERWAARALLAWLAVGLVSALASQRPGLAVVGLFNQGTGWLFMAVLGGAWAIGTAVGRPGRRLVGTALVTGAVANAVVAVGQMTVGLGRVGLPGYGGQADGFLGNPVFLGGLEAAALVIMAGRLVRRPRRAWLPTLLLAAGVALSGERLSMLIAVALALVVPSATWLAGSDGDQVRGVGAGRGSRLAARLAAGAADLPASNGRSGLPGAGLFTVTVGAGLAAGVALPLLRASNALANKLSATAEATFGDRLHAWLEGARAVLHAPLIGSGPGQFGAATEALFPRWFVRAHQGQIFTDAHNIGVEYAVTTGLVGLALLVAFAVAAVRSGRGPLVGFAAVLLAVELVEPLNPVLTPLLFLAAGAAAGAGRAALPGSVPGGADVPVASHGDGWQGGEALATGAGGMPERVPAGRPVRARSRLLVVATGLAGLLAVAGAADLLVGVDAMVRSHAALVDTSHAAALADARLAVRVLPAWPEPAQAMASVELLGRQASPTAPTPLERAARWEQVAAARDPADAPAWLATAEMELQLHRLATARRYALAAQARYPWGAGTLRLLGSISLAEHRPSAARRWFSLLVRVQPRPDVAQLMAGACAQTSPFAAPTGAPRC